MTVLPFTRGFLAASAWLDGDEITRWQGIAQKIYMAPGYRLGDVPIALRWVHDPLLGFPRQPFLVSRLTSVPAKADPLAGGGSFRNRFDQSMAESYEAGVVVSPAPGTRLTVMAIGEDGTAIAGQSAQVTGFSEIWFRSAGIFGLRVLGLGDVLSMRHRPLAPLLADPGWEPIEMVGLPFAGGPGSVSYYATEAQGFFRPQPALTGAAAALQRLTVMAQLSLPLPLAGWPAALSQPFWNESDPAAYLADLVRPGMLDAIARCLSQSDEADPARQQTDFLYARTVPGLRGVGGAAIDRVDAEIPVVAMTMLSVAADSEAASALGYGTVDAPPADRGQRPIDRIESGRASLVVAPGAFFPTVEYRISNRWEIIPGVFREFGALAMMQPLPKPASPLTAARRSQQRPLAVDEPARVSARVSWPEADFPQGHAIARSDDGKSAEFRNALRPASVGGSDLFLAGPSGLLRPGGNRTNWQDPGLAVPDMGTATYRYMAIPRDRFGRWGSWSETSLTLTPPPPQMPVIQSVSLDVDLAGRISGTRRIIGKLTIEVAWDWTERAPAWIDLVGGFLSEATLVTMQGSGGPPPPPPAGFTAALSGTTGAAAPLRIQFTGNTASVTGAGRSIVELTSPPGPAAVRRWRVEVIGINCDFMAATTLTYAVSARGAERIRSSVTSPFVVPPRPARAHDPIPPDPPSLPTPLQWTALPDAMGTARGLLSWPAMPGAAGYHVWEASEMGLRVALDPQAPTTLPDDPVLVRAAQLRSASAADANAPGRSFYAFGRLTTAAITATRYELSLPGAAEDIHGFLVTAVSATGLESGRSGVALFAVPRLAVPAPPRLQLRPAQNSQGDPAIEVLAVPGDASALAGMRLFRVRASHLADSVGTMGPPILPETDARWQNHVLTEPAGPVTGKIFIDTPPPGWLACHYRVVAVGAADAANGRLSGVSAASAAVRLAIAPVSPPRIVNAAKLAGNSAVWLIGFAADLPARTDIGGPARIELIDITANQPNRRVLLAMDFAAFAQGPPLMAADLAAGAGQARRGAPAADRMTQVTLTVVAPAGTLILRLTDPLGRNAEFSLGRA